MKDVDERCEPPFGYCDFHYISFAVSAAPQPQVPTNPSISRRNFATSPWTLTAR
jgi:hypothetical protein